jgi:predicted DNA-binding transcriptional regulator AlpA
MKPMTREQLFSSTPFTPEAPVQPAASMPEEAGSTSAAAEDVLLPTRKVWERYGVVDRTLYRWLNDIAMGFPEPIIINRKMFFRLSELVTWERARVRGRAPITSGVSTSNEQAQPGLNRVQGPGQ